MRITTFILSVFLATSAFANDVIYIEWEDVATATGYNVYWGPVSAAADGFTAYNYKYDVGDVNIVSVNVLQEHRNWYFAVSAYNAGAEESALSSEVFVGYHQFVSANTWYVGPAAAEYGPERGWTKATAFDGSAGIVWGLGGVMPGDTLRAASADTVGSLTIGGSGESGYPIHIRQMLLDDIDDDGNDYVNIESSIVNGSSGVGVTSTGTNNNIYNLTIYGTTGHGIDHSEDITIKNVIFESIGGSDINATGGSATTATNYADADGDPLFNDASAGNFRLRRDSPCIDAGTDVGLTADFDGNGFRGAPDIGAYEYYPPQRSQ